jgi:NTP pyrophosphatase (non-canonical NTP hydrolase)
MAKLLNRKITAADSLSVSPSELVFWDGWHDMNSNKSNRMEDLITLVQIWARDRGLIEKENASRQMLKVVEELGELAGCLAKGKNREETTDAFGDVMVTLIILAAQTGYDLEACLEHAYDEIKLRTGKTEDGVFIKD